jgi:hypothetical protein
VSQVLEAQPELKGHVDRKELKERLELQEVLVLRVTQVPKEHKVAKVLLE